MPTLPEQPVELSGLQRVVARYLTFVLIDLCILNLFVEFWDRVVIDSFTISLLAAIVLQASLRLTLWAKNRARAIFAHVTGALGVLARLLSMWAVSFSSKFVIMWVIDLIFGVHVEFFGVKPLFAVLITMLVVETLVMKLFWTEMLSGRPRAHG